jgi:hypothetical protein
MSYAVRVGLDPVDFSGHSLRSGFLTSAAARNASIFNVSISILPLPSGMIGCKRRLKGQNDRLLATLYRR